MIGFYTLDSEDLLKTLGVSREYRNKRQVRNEAMKTLKEIGIPVYPRGNKMVVKQTDIDTWLEELDSESINLGDYTPKSKRL